MHNIQHASSDLNIEVLEMKPHQPINRHVIALITFFALVPLVYFIPDLIGQFLPAIKWIQSAIVVGIIVPIISYGVIPTANFLYKGIA